MFFEKEEEKTVKNVFKDFFEKKPNNEELYVFFVQLAAFYKAGSLLQAFDKMQSQIKNEKLSQAVKAMKEAMESEGVPLSVAMSEQRIFTPFVIQAVKAGEMSGTLDSVLKEIGITLKQEGEISRRINSALLPIKFVLALLVVAVLIIFFYIVPKFKKVFLELNVQLPLMSRIVFNSMDVLINNWYLFLIGTIAMIFLYRFVRVKYAEQIDRLVFKIPVYKEVYFFSLQYRIATMFCLMRSAGIGNKVTLEQLALVADNALVNKAFISIANLIETEGFTLSESFERNNQEGIFDYVLLSYLNTGEESGTTTELLLAAKEYYAEILFTKLQDFGTKITPIFLMPIMTIILLIMLAIYVPMFTLTQGIHK